MIFYIVGAIVLLVVGFLLYRNNVVKKQAANLASQRSERIQPLVAKLESDATLDDVKPFAYALATREEAYLLLKERNRLDLFPKELITIEKAAAAHLAVWLEFPTELDAIPDEIEHVERVRIPFDAENSVYYHVFKYRINEPHWAAKDGWMLGVVGPYFDDSQPYDFPGATFSRVDSKFGVIPAEEEAKWVHENIGLSKIKGE